ncbi:spore-associated protein A [Streptomyces sp. NPDC047042]|uniref:spore-associated protein A n=1 Tax=Streptomyces sp. NPDC047042 TaxID=3154807 RepID=UPI0033CC3840
MKLSRRRTATTAALASATALTALFATAAPASAAIDTGYNGVCGTGYKVVATTAVGRVGRIFVTWNEAEGQSCAVTIRNSTGPRIHMGIELNVLADHETTPMSDADDYFTYAGPVHYPSRGYCVQWSGVVGDVEASGTGVCN